MTHLRVSSAEVRRFPRGVVLRLNDDADNSGFGEASPIARSEESIEDAQEALESLCKNLPGEWSASSTLALCHTLSGACTLPPSSRFALESAVLDLLARRERVPVHMLLAERTPESVSVNALVPLDETAFGTMQAASDQGFTVFKFKMPGTIWRDEFQLLEDARKRYPDAEFRIDANQKWPADSIAERWSELATLNIRYVEEPTPIENLPPNSTLPIALDESLALYSRAQIEALIQKHQVVALAIKPGEAGGILRSLALAQTAKNAGISVLVTHFAGGPIELATTCELALACSNAACGLAPHSGLETWPALAVPQLQGSRVIPTKNPGIGPSIQELANWFSA